VQGHASVDYHARRVLAHVEVDLSIEEPHADGLVTDNGLVMRFSISNALLPISTIR
jgi:hypothetical protein